MLDPQANLWVCTNSSGCVCPPLFPLVQCLNIWRLQKSFHHFHSFPPVHPYLTHRVDQHGLVKSSECSYQQSCQQTRQCFPSFVLLLETCNRSELNLDISFWTSVIWICSADVVADKAFHDLWWQWKYFCRQSTESVWSNLIMIQIHNMLTTETLSACLKIYIPWRLFWKRSILSRNIFFNLTVYMLLSGCDKLLFKNGNI